MNTQALAALIGKDFRLFFANRFFALVTVLALVAYTAVFYLLPASIDDRLELGIYMVDLPPALSAALADDGIAFYRAESVAALQQAVLDGAIPAGYAFPDDTLSRIARGEPVTAQLFLAVDVPPGLRDIYTVILHEFGYVLSGQDLAIETTEIILGDDMAGAQIAPRQRMLPLLTVIVLMVECLGLASLIAGEVATKTIRALLVTPLTMTGLFVGKGVFGTLFAFAQAAILMLVTGGLAQQPVLILTALLFGAALVTGVAFLIASVGRDLMSVLGWGMLALLLLTLPAMTILIPGLATNWIRLIPSYYLADTVYRVVNFNASWGDVAGNLIVLPLYAAAFLALGIFVLRRKFL
jgi:ABC-2 type transport system permease protein